MTSILGNAQTPQSISIQSSPGTPSVGALKMACADQFAGTISFDNFIGQSNDIDLDTIYFCLGDAVDIMATAMLT